MLFKLKNIFEIIGSWIRSVVDFFYPPFRKYMTLQFFRYGVTGSLNLFFDWVLYFFLYNFVLRKQPMDLAIVTISSHIATLAVKFPIILFSGFLLQKYVTFSYSEIRGRIQLFRYLVVVLVNLLINYLGLKFLVDLLGFYPTISNMLISGLTVFVSYFSQKRYTFKTKKI